MLRRMKSIPTARNAVVVLLSIALVLSFVPLAPRVAAADEPQVERAAIADLLAAGEYVEGEAIAIVRESAEPETSAASEDIATVDADSVELAVEGATDAGGAADVAAERVPQTSADSFTVKQVVDHNRTTEQILQELYADPNVIAAEPNYLIGNPAALDGASGTHVAGIIAASWNDQGVSGIAHGARVFAMRIFGNEGQSQTETAILKGYRFLIDIAKDVNLKAINCSWGNVRPQFILTVLSNELGKKGVVSVYASGNRSCDLDTFSDTGGSISSPYVITVNATSANGKMSDFSCWGSEFHRRIRPWRVDLLDRRARGRQDI